MLLFNPEAHRVGIAGEEYEGDRGIFDLPEEAAAELLKFPDWTFYTGQDRPENPDASFVEPSGEPGESTAEPEAEFDLATAQRDALVAYAEANGITVDGRWGAERIRATILDAIEAAEGESTEAAEGDEAPASE